MAKVVGLDSASPTDILGGNTSDAAEIMTVGAKATSPAREDISGPSGFDAVATGAFTGACARDQNDRRLLLLSNALLARSAITDSYVISLRFILSHNRLVSFCCPYLLVCGLALHTALYKQLYWVVLSIVTK